MHARNILCKGNGYLVIKITCTKRNVTLTDSESNLLMHLDARNKVIFAYFSAAPLPKNTQGKPVGSMSIWKLNHNM